MLGNLNGPTLVVILIIVLLLFGAPKLPGLAKSLGQSMRILKKEVRSDDEERSERREPASSAPPADRVDPVEPPAARPERPAQGPDPEAEPRSDRP